MTYTVSVLADKRGQEELARTRKIYRSVKAYDHNEGLSCCFRQWRATHSHCSKLHGYALAFRFVFQTDQLDQHNWCFDFGNMKPVRSWLHEMFDHTVLVSPDDPQLAEFRRLASLDLIDLRVLPAVGCESIARFVFDFVTDFVRDQTDGRVWVESVEVLEHAGNSASYQNAAM